jgi:hypothetical protein
MHVVYIQYHYDTATRTPEDYLEKNKEKVQFYIDIHQAGIERVSIIQRAPFSQKIVLNEMHYYFIKDEYGAILRWYEKPVKVHTTATAIEPDIIHVYGLNLPIHYRWLRKSIGRNIFLLGQHCGEKIWLQRILWLQQFGLRVVDEFIFQNEDDLKHYLKAAVILPKQALYKIADLDQYTKKSAARLVKIYQELVNK